MLSLFSFMDNQSISYVGVGVIVSVAIFAAYKAGQVCGLLSVEKQIQLMDFERLKQKTTYVLERLWGDTQGNSQLPGERNFEVVVDNFLFPEDSLREKILLLDHIYFDLACNGASSSYFVYILNEYGQNVM
jgi:hypothetical protein